MPDPNDIANLSPPPVSARVNSGDAIPFGRLPSDPTQDSSPFLARFGELDPAIRPKSLVTAGGSTADDASALTTPVAIITAATAGGGVYLRGVPHETQTLVNATGIAVAVYGPQPAGQPAGTVNGNPSVTLPPGDEANFHTRDGSAYFAPQ